MIMTLVRPGDPYLMAFREICLTPIMVLALKSIGEPVMLNAGAYVSRADAILKKFAVSGVSVSDCDDDSGLYADSLNGVAVTSSARLSALEREMRRNIVDKLMDDGVFFTDPDAVYISPDVVIGPGTTVYPNVLLRYGTRFGADCDIGMGCDISGSTFGDRARLRFVQAVDCTVGNDVDIGPYANLRPNCLIADNVHIGDFMELKNASIGKRSKLSHLSYVGDSDVGCGVNIGCGCVTVNYNGFKKNRTVIRDGAFIGCNTNLVAPITVGAGAYTAAGSTVTADVPDDALAVARARQANKPDWANSYRIKNT